MQEYKLYVSTVWGGDTTYVNNEPHIRNLREAEEYLKGIYLEKGYKILSVDFLGEVIVNELEASNSPKALRFAWHLVREANGKA